MRYFRRDYSPRSPDMWEVAGLLAGYGLPSMAGMAASAPMRPSSPVPPQQMRPAARLSSPVHPVGQHAAGAACRHGVMGASWANMGK